MFKMYRIYIILVGDSYCHRRTSIKGGGASMKDWETIIGETLKSNDFRRFQMTRRHHYRL